MNSSAEEATIQTTHALWRQHVYGDWALCNVSVHTSHQTTVQVMPTLLSANKAIGARFGSWMSREVMVPPPKAANSPTCRGSSWYVQKQGGHCYLNAGTLQHSAACAITGVLYCGCVALDLGLLHALLLHAFSCVRQCSDYFFASKSQRGHIPSMRTGTGP